MGLLVLAAVMGGEAQENERVIRDVNFYFNELTQGVGPCFCNESPPQGPVTRQEAAQEEAAPQEVPKDFSLHLA